MDNKLKLSKISNYYTECGFYRTKNNTVKYSFDKVKKQSNHLKHLFLTPKDL